MSADPNAAAPGETPSGSTPGAVPASTNGVDRSTPPTASAVVSPGAPRAPKRAAATNARDLLSGKREREGFFDAEDDARAKAAARRAAAAAEKLRAEEELIARWRGEDRLKQQQRLEERKRKIRLRRRGDDGENANVVDAPDAAKGRNDGDDANDAAVRDEDGAELGAARTELRRGRRPVSRAVRRQRRRHCRYHRPFEEKPTAGCGDAFGASGGAPRAHSSVRAASSRGQGRALLRMHELRVQQARLRRVLEGPARAVALRARGGDSPRRPARADVLPHGAGVGGRPPGVHKLHPRGGGEVRVLQHRRAAIVAAGVPAAQRRRPALPHARAGGDRAAEPAGGAEQARERKRGQGARRAGSRGARRAGGLRARG